MVKNIIFDFDGVILDSIPVKTQAFKKLFNDFPSKKVEMLVSFHLKNRGMSRYNKIEYFFKHIMNEQVENQKILEYAKRYSEITKKELAQPKYLILDSVDFVKKNYKKYNMHIASGADEKDLKYICERLNLNNFFISINGSPKIKSEIVKDILINFNYLKKETILIGDSVNDYEAAFCNSIKFYGCNNEELKPKGNYIDFCKRVEL